MQTRANVCFSFVILAFAFTGCGAGQRLLTVRVEKDGATILTSQFGVSDRLTPPAIWRSMRGKAFDAINEIAPLAKDSEKAELKGKLRIVIMHVDREMASGLFEDIRLSRVPGPNNQWEIPPAEVERTAKVAGL